VHDEPPVFLRPEPLRHLAERAVAHEAGFAVFLGLLTGMRRGEIMDLTWDEIDIAAREIRLGTRTKTHRARTIDLSVCPSVVGMLERAPRTGSLVFARRGTAAWHAWAAELRPPYWSWKVLRATCGTYLACAPGIWGASSAYRTARQLGHTVAIAEKYYLGVIRIDPMASTLEKAMSIGDLAEKINT
jgi:integrase